MKVTSHGPELVETRKSVWITLMGTEEGCLLTANRRGSSRDARAIHDVLFGNIGNSEMFSLHGKNATRGFELNIRRMTDIFSWRVAEFVLFSCAL